MAMLNRWITKSLSWSWNLEKAVWLGGGGMWMYYGGVSKTGKYMKQSPKSTLLATQEGWKQQNKQSQVSRFCSTASHHSSMRKMEMFDGGE